MSASPVHYRKPATGCVTVLSPFLRYLNTSTLAFVMFVAFALLSSIRGKDSEIRELASAKVTKTGVFIANFSFSPKTLSGVARRNGDLDQPGQGAARGDER